MRIVFFGSGEFAVPSLFALGASRHEIALVVTMPDRPAGRGGRLRETPVKRAALELGVPVYQTPTLRGDEPLERLRAESPDICVIIAFGCLVPPEMLAVPPHGFLNAHASILPKYRGAAPVPHAILEGETETGVTVFRLAETWDSGPVYDVARTPIRASDTAGTVLERLSLLAPDTLLSVVDGIEAGTAEPLPQSDAEATPAPKFSREDGCIDWSDPADSIDRQVRAFQPWPSAYAFFPGKRGKRRRVLVLGAEREPACDDADARPGQVLRADDRDGVVVAAGDGKALRLTRIRPEGKGEMTGAEYMRGATLAPGEVLDGDA